MGNKIEFVLTDGYEVLFSLIKNANNQRIVLFLHQRCVT
jgi:hypothetical protein